jgi:hypothetical protein
MTDDRSLERAARSWLDEGPTRAPDQPVEAALSRIQTIQQDRDLRIPWRLHPMNPSLRLGGIAIAAIAVVAVAVALVALGVGPNVGDRSTHLPQTAAPSTGVSSTPAEPAIAAGTYSTDVPVAEILQELDAQDGLSAAERAAIIDDILAIRGATTLHIQVVLTDKTFNFLQGVDDQALHNSIPIPWTVTAFEGRDLTLDTGRTDSFRTQHYEVDGSRAMGYQFHPVSPAASEVETFVRHVLFELGWFYG